MEEKHSHGSTAARLEAEKRCKCCCHGQVRLNGKITEELEKGWMRLLRLEYNYPEKMEDL